MTDANSLRGFNESTRPTSVRYFVLIWLCAAAAIAYLQRNSLSIVHSSVRADLGLDDRQMGWAYGIFFLSYGAFQIPSGRLGDRWGARVAIPVLSSLWSLATVLTAAIGWMFVSLRGGAESLPANWIVIACAVMLAARLLAGAAQAGIFPCSAVVIHRWLPSSRWGFATGWLTSFQQVGAMLATACTALLVTWELSWQSIFIIYSIPGFIWAALYYSWFRNRPREHANVNNAELLLIEGDRPVAVESSSNEKPAEPVPWGVLLTSRPMWAFCSQQFCRAAAYNFYASWFPNYLQETRHISVAKSGLLTTLPVAATFFGTILSGTISDWLLARTGSRRIARQLLSIVGLLFSALFIFAAWFVQGPVEAVLVISAGSFFAAFAGPTSYALSIEMGGKHVSAVFGGLNMSGSFGAFALPVVIGYIRQYTGSWDAVLMLFAGIYVVAAGFWVLFNPNGTMFDHAKQDQPTS